MAVECIYGLDPNANSRSDDETGADYVWELDGAFIHAFVSFTLLLHQFVVGFSLIFGLGNRAFIIQGIIAGSVFLRVPEHTAGYYSRGGIIFL